MPHSAVSDRKRDQAKKLRNTMTRAEVLLWRYLKAHRLDELAFRRQAPIGIYIVDFVCHSARIIIEIDGSTHEFAERLQHDRQRDTWLGKRGYKVIRVTNDQVLSSLEGVLTVIRETALSRVLDTPPSLSLPRKGGGNAQTAPARARGRP